MTNYSPPNYDPRYSPPVETPPSKKSRVLLRIIYISLAVIIAASLLMIYINVKNKQHTVAPTATPSATAPASARPSAAAKGIAAPPHSNAAVTVAQGTFIVGTDVPAGKYKTKGANQGDLCYWHTAKDDSNNQIVDQGVVNNVAEPGYVTLKSGQYFKTSGCQPWVKQ